jgi:ribosomal protein S18 acetylase RimI-like enzyme
MGDVTVREFAAADRADVVALWHVCDLVRPWNDPDRDIERKLAVGDSMFLVAEDERGLVGTVMAGYDGHRGWINYLAVAPTEQGRGIGALMMDEAERRLRDIGCAKINLQIRSGNEAAAAFYERLGYRIDAVVGLGKRLVDDRAYSPDR